MTIIQTIILGIVEGITEFLPVSSTFHLIWTSQVLNIAQSDFLKLFEVFIQSGAIIAVVIIYAKEILKNKNLMKNLFLSFIPTAIVGLLLYKVIKGVFFENLILSTSVFLFVGLLFLIFEKKVKNKFFKLDKNLDKLTFRKAIMIGIIQSLAVIPGVSRAGAVILGLMYFGFKREESAKYSFMLSIPTIFAASIFDLYKMRTLIIQNSGNLYLLLLGFFMAFISAFIGIKWLIGYLQNHSLEFFGWYRILVGIILLFMLVV